MAIPDARRFGGRGPAVLLLVGAVFGPLQYSWYMARFPGWGSYAPRDCSHAGISSAYVILGSWVTGGWTRRGRSAGASASGTRPIFPRHFSGLTQHEMGAAIPAPAGLYGLHALWSFFAVADNFDPVAAFAIVRTMSDRPIITITGAGRGIGAATAKLAAARGLPSNPTGPPRSDRCQARVELR
jgi:hypothetical protein